jgi:uncharacterized protein
VGIGLRDPYYQPLLKEKPPIGWLEVHSENVIHCGGAVFEYLLELRQHYPVSLHGIGLSLGSSDGLDQDFLLSLKKLIDAVQPCFISEHLSWSRVDGIYMPDLLPLPYNEETFDIFYCNIQYAQDVLQCPLWIENPSSYITYKHSIQRESLFLSKLCQKAGTKLLLDVNNLFVSCKNHNWDMTEYLSDIEGEDIGEYHLAGHCVEEIAPDLHLRLDTHDRPVLPEVWSLYDRVLEAYGPRPTLLEWDAELPPLDTVLEEAQKIHHQLTAYYARQNAYAL